MAAIKGIKGEVREELKEAISEAVGPIKIKITGIENSVKNVENTLGQTVAKVTDLEEKIEGILLGSGGGGGGGENTEKLQKQVDELSDKLANTTLEMDPKKTSTIIVLGGFTNFSSLSVASKWLSDFVWENFAPTPVEIFMRRADGEYSGAFYASFASPIDRIKALGVVKSKLVEVGDKTKWANVDLPKEIQAQEKYLFGVKKVLVGWGTFTSGSIRAEVDGPTKYIKAGLGAEGKVIVTVTCKKNGALVCDWDESWKGWDEFHGSAEIKTLTEKCNKLLGGGKGSGKKGSH